MYLFYCSWAAAKPILVCHGRSKIRTLRSGFGFAEGLAEHLFPAKSQAMSLPILSRLVRSLLPSADNGGHCLVPSLPRPSSDLWIIDLLSDRTQGAQWHRDPRTALAISSVVEGLRVVPCLPIEDHLTVSVF